jgi:hypothetical protein
VNHFLLCSGIALRQKAAQKRNDMVTVADKRSVVETFPIERDLFE